MNKSEILKSEGLQKRADFFAQASLSAATRKAYESDWRLFHLWCVEHNFQSLPCDPSTICLYLTDLAGHNAVTTIARKITSIRAIHDASGHLSPTRHASVNQVFRGIKNTIGASSEHSRPISWSELKRMLSQTDRSMIGLRDAALLSLGWTSALRRSEIVALNIDDLEFQEDGLIVRIRRSKTDQEGLGCYIGIPRGREECPVARVQAWLARRNSYEGGEPLFTSIGAQGRGAWYWESLKRLPDRMVTLIVKKYGNLTGLPILRTSAHSLRRGMATEAGAKKVPERIIARHTRHASIAVLRSYIEAGTIWSENPLLAIYPTSSGSGSGSQQNS